MLKAVLLSLAATVALAGCTTTGIDRTIQEKLPQTCALLDSAHAAFTLIAATGQVPAATVRKEAAAYAGVTVFCEDPSRVTASNALVLVAGAYAVVVVALREADEATR